MTKLVGNAEAASARLEMFMGMGIPWETHGTGSINMPNMGMAIVSVIMGMGIATFLISVKNSHGFVDRFQSCVFVHRQQPANECSVKLIVCWKSVVQTYRQKA